MTRVRTTHWLVPLIALALCAASAFARAHPGVFATALAKVEASGEVTITLRADILAFALDQTPMEVEDPPMHALLDGPDAALADSLEAARIRYLEQFALEVDGQPVAFELLASPTVADIREWQRSQAVRSLPARLDFIARARVPAGLHTFAVRFPPSLGDVITTFDRDQQEPVALPLGPGESSPSIDVRIEPPAAPLAASPLAAPPESSQASPADGPPPQAQATPPTPAPPLSSPTVVTRYFILGFEHIIPKGLDHLLFVLGLFLLSPKLKPLIWQVSAFTLAHTITLALTILGAIRVSPDIVEPIIAASIALIAIENLLTTKVHPWRPAVVFVFGLFHGLGFAGVLTELGLPQGQLATALISFNVGVEAAQLAVIGAAWLLTLKLRNRPWYRSRITIPASVTIALVAGYWTVERVFGPFFGSDLP